jgi:hypothetical protein
MSAAGVWKVVIQSPMGAQEVALTLKQEGAALSGTAASAMFGSTDLENVAVNGDALTFTMNVKSPLPMTVEGEATISGDSMTGSMKAGAFGAFPLTGARA